MPAEPSQTIPTLSLRPREAARALGMSARTLWSLTASNQIPHIRLSRMVLYPTAELTRWLSDRAAAQAEGGGK